MNPYYTLWECDKGNRWSTKNEGICDGDHTDGDWCWFSGCKTKEHRLHLRNPKATADEAIAWFINANNEYHGGN